MALITLSFMVGLGAGTGVAGIASSIDALTETRAPRTVAVRRAGARSATVRARAEDTVMAAMLEVVEVWMCGRGREVRVGVR